MWIVLPLTSRLPTKIVVWRQGFFLSPAHNYVRFHLPPVPLDPSSRVSGQDIPLSSRHNVPFRVNEEGHSCQGRQESERRVITPSHCAPVCPSSCPNTQTARLARHFKERDADCSLSSAPHRGVYVVSNQREEQWSPWKPPGNFCLKIQRCFFFFFKIR